MGVGGFFYWKFRKGIEGNKGETSIEETKEAAFKTETKAVPKRKAPRRAPITIKDSDKDGLSDEREKELGTDPNSPDTDKDGLSDYLEIKVYETNPLNPDTDGDSYLDGEEVKAGYNPRGEGKLRDLQKEIQKLKEKE